MKKDREWLKEEVEDLQIYSNPEVRADRSDPYTQYVGGVNDAVSRVKELLDQLDEPKKVVIPQFVAEAFEKAREDNWFASQLINAMYDSSDEVGYWLEVPSNEKLLLRAWLDGYEVEKEAFYRIKIGGFLYFVKFDDVMPVFVVDDTLGVVEEYAMTTSEDEAEKIIRILGAGELESVEVAE